MSAMHTKMMPAIETVSSQQTQEKVPGTLILLASPATVLLTMLAGWLLLTALHQPLFKREMFAAGIVNALGGILAALPLLRAARGTKAIAQASIIGIGIRSGSILLGLVIMVIAGWGLDRMPLVYWILACYFPLLMAETTLSAWLSYKAPDEALTRAT